LRWRWGDCFEGEEKYRTSGRRGREGYAKDAKEDKNENRKIQKNE
jgi:hypothetical protein